MNDGVLEIETRMAFLYYLQKRLGLDIDPDIRKPQDQHIVPLNRDEVDATQRRIAGGNAHA